MRIDNAITYSLNKYKNNMALKKGVVLNPNGRPQGSPNKSTTEIRNAFQMLVSQNIEQLQNDLSEMTPDKRVSYIIKLSEFILPKLQSLSLDTQIDLEYKSLEALLAKAPDEVIERLTQKILTLKSLSNESD